MQQISTIQKRENLNEVWVRDQIGSGGANHLYTVYKDTLTDPVTLQHEKTPLLNIQFQHGPRANALSTDGVLDVDLLEVVRHRLIAFQKGPFSSRENDKALMHIEEALMWMNKRVEDRIERQVLSKELK